MGYSIPKHRCSFCLELIGLDTDDAPVNNGVIWLVDAGENPRWLTACYVCLDLVPFDTRQELYGYYSYTRVFTRDINSIMSAIEHMHKFSFDTPTEKLWNSEVSKTFFTHLGMHSHGGCFV
jgi:hypothetical protein